MTNCQLDNQTDAVICQSVCMLKHSVYILLHEIFLPLQKNCYKLLLQDHHIQRCANVGQTGEHHRNILESSSFTYSFADETKTSIYPNSSDGGPCTSKVGNIKHVLHDIQLTIYAGAAFCCYYEKQQLLPMIFCLPGWTWVLGVNLWSIVSL